MWAGETLHSFRRECVQAARRRGDADADTMARALLRRPQTLALYADATRPTRAAPAVGIGSSDA